MDILKFIELVRDYFKEKGLKPEKDTKREEKILKALQQYQEDGII